MHGKFVLHPVSGRRIPIICDAELVDMAFGTGAVKVGGRECVLEKRGASPGVGGIKGLEQDLLEWVAAGVPGDLPDKGYMLSVG